MTARRMILMHFVKRCTNSWRLTALQVYN